LPLLYLSPYKFRLLNENWDQLCDRERTEFSSLLCSITGGPDAPSPWTNLIRIKKIFPLQPAWETGKLKVRALPRHDI
jgi:hypothetical protein